MAMFAAQTPSRQLDDETADELKALSRMETTSNGIRLRIAGLAPDQLYRGTVDALSIAEEVALAVDREKAYLDIFQRAQRERSPHLEEPEPGPALLDRDFSDDLASFFDLRRATLDVLRTLSDEAWGKTVTLPDGSHATLRQLAVRLAQHDERMIRTISEQRKGFLRTSGVNDLRDYGVAGKLGPNLAQ